MCMCGYVIYTLIAVASSNHYVLYKFKAVYIFLRSISLAYNQ